MLVFETVIYTQ